MSTGSVTTRGAGSVSTRASGTLSADATGLRGLLARPAPAAPPPGQRCELCAGPIGPAADDHRRPVAADHRHLVDLERRVLRCSCRACGLLFDRPGAGAGRYRLVPEHRRHLPEFVLDDGTWRRLGVPVEVAFFFRDSAAGRTVGFYPSPGGAVESTLDPQVWSGLETANPVLTGTAPDVEALLVNRVGGAREHWLVPIDDCYALVGLIRTHWRGLAGGSEVWQRLEDFFAQLRGGRP